MQFLQLSSVWVLSANLRQGGLETTGCALLSASCSLAFLQRLPMRKLWSTAQVPTDDAISQGSIALEVVASVLDVLSLAHWTV